MNIAKSLFVYALLLAICMFNEQAIAGSVSGPYVIWANLGNVDKNIMDGTVKHYLESGDDFCWQDGDSIMFMGNYPKVITENLIYDALILKKKSAIEKLNQLLTHKFSSTWSGYDGVIVYTDQDGPKFTSMTTGSKKIKSRPIRDISKTDAIRFALCSVMPPITRAP